MCAGKDLRLIAHTNIMAFEGDIVVIVNDFSAYFGLEPSSPSIDFWFITRSRMFAFSMGGVAKAPRGGDVLSLSAKRQLCTFANFVEWATSFVVAQKKNAL